MDGNRRYHEKINSILGHCHLEDRKPEDCRALGISASASFAVELAGGFLTGFKLKRRRQPISAAPPWICKALRQTD